METVEREEIRGKKIKTVEERGSREKGGRKRKER
jgi:hypothetical protein